MEISRDDLLLMGEEKANFIARLLLNNKNNKTSVAIAKNFFYGEKQETRIIEINDFVVYPKLYGGIDYGKVIDKFRTFEWKLKVQNLEGQEVDIPYRIVRLANDEQKKYYETYSCQNFNV